MNLFEQCLQRIPKNRKVFKVFFSGLKFPNLSKWPADKGFKQNLNLFNCGVTLNFNLNENC